jgi:hypothetical protein
MSEITAEERLLVQRQIACIIDHPSVGMGGPSQNSMRKAGNIIASLEAGKRLVSTACDHSGWIDFRRHGTHCPDCGKRT